VDVIAEHRPVPARRGGEPFDWVRLEERGWWPIFCCAVDFHEVRATPGYRIRTQPASAHCASLSRGAAKSSPQRFPPAQRPRTGIRDELLAAARRAR